MADTNQQKTEQFASQYAALESAGAFRGQNGFGSIRKSAMDRFANLGLPTTRQEDWRFTSVAALGRHQFRPSEPGAKPDLQAVEFDLLAGLTDLRAVFVNGHLSADLSDLTKLPAGMTVMSLKEAIAAERPELKTYLSKIVVDQTHPFVALNTALFQDGAFVTVAEGAVIESPLHLIFLSTSPDGNQPVLSHPRNLFMAGRHSQSTIIETFAGAAGEVYFSNAVTEISVGDDAVLDHYRYQQESKQAFHFATLEVQIGRKGNFSTHGITFGGQLVRNDIGFTLNGDGAYGVMNGLYQIADNQHVDNHTRMDHAFPNCETHELYKGILDGHARGVFNGKIMVRQIAQKTNAKQTNRNLLMSTDALMNSNPQLEIFADDVKCTHGATIGQLDETQLYYLRSRGIPLEHAKRLLTYAFGNDVIERVKVESLRKELEKQILAAHAAPSELVTSTESL